MIAALRSPRLLWPILAATSVVTMVVQIPLPHATAWHFFEDAAHLLASEGLGLYGGRPDLQFGPLSIVVALPFTALGDAGSWAAMVAFSALGLGVVWLLFDAAGGGAGPVAPAYLPAGMLFVVVWGDVAVRTAHIDDAVTVAATALAVWAVVRRRPGWVVVALAVAGAAKPWGLVFAPLAAVAPGPERWWRVLVVVGLVALTWAPFLLAEPATLDASSFEIVNEASSALRRLGVAAAATPRWVRPVQLLGGAAIAAALVRWGRWHRAVMAAVAFRLLIDPAANRYYTVGLVLGLLILELFERPDRWPWMAVLAAAVLEFGQAGWVPAALSGWLRLGVTVGVIGFAFAAAPAAPIPRPSVGRARREDEPDRHSEPAGPKNED